MLRRNSEQKAIGSDEIGNYVVLAQIGIGSVATVYKAENTAVAYDSPLRCVAFKRMSRSYETIGKQETVVLSQLRGCKHIVQCFGAFHFKGEFVIATELLDYEREFSLLSRPSSLTQWTALDNVLAHDGYTTLAKIALQLLLAVVEINKVGYVHCDLKPENVLFQRGYQHRLKVFDFGNATAIKDLGVYRDSYEVQSLAYRAPEVLIGDPTFNQKIDVWSVGVILLELYVNALFKSHGGRWRLVQHSNPKDIVKGLIKKLGSMDIYATRGTKWDGEFEFRHWYTREEKSTFMQRLATKDPNENRNKVLNFLQGLLVLDHNNRMTAEQALRHPFLTTTLLSDWAQVLAR